ncbi:glycoside hydrolase family 5 protein, partial [Tulasnella calospora MUT 4182]
MKLSAGLAAVAASIAVSGVAAVPQWGQCGGLYYTGSTVCDSPYVCVYQNDFLVRPPKDSQCLAGSTTTTTTKSSTTTTSTTTTKSSTTTTKSSTTTTTTSATPSATTKKFKLFGVNESCAEFGTAIPGVLGTDYTWPEPSSIDYFVGKGFNTFRVAFTVERLTPGSLAGSYDSAYMASLKNTVSYITGKGAYAVIDPHNYLRYNGAVLTDVSAFANWWKNLANQFKDNSRVILDMQNEPWGIDATVVASFMQAAVNGIRSVGATNLILVEGTSWSGAWSWTTSSGNAAAFTGFTDPANNFAI